MRTVRTTLAILSLLAVTVAASASFTLQPLTTFGGGDGWLAPGDRPYLTTDNTQRGIAYNPLSNRVYLVNRAGGLSVRILDGDTGDDLGTLDVTGITGGTFALSAIGVGADGAIYAANLTTASGTSPLKVYRWADESAAPTLAYSGNPVATSARFGDSLAVRGSGANTQIVLGAGSSPAGFNAYTVLTSTDGVNYAAGYVSITGPANGAFRLGVDFGAGNTVFGKQTGSASNVEGTSFDLGTLTGARLVGSPYTATTAGEALLAVEPNYGLLATTDINSGNVRLYDINDLAASGLTFLHEAVFPGTRNPNTNGTGQMDWGNNRLYVLDTNNGIRVYELIPEPAAIALLALGVLALRRR